MYGYLELFSYRLYIGKNTSFKSYPFEFFTKKTKIISKRIW